MRWNTFLRWSVVWLLLLFFALVCPYTDKHSKCRYGRQTHQRTHRRKFCDPSLSNQISGALAQVGQLFVGFSPAHFGFCTAHALVINKVKKIIWKCYDPFWSDVSVLSSYYMYITNSNLRCIMYIKTVYIYLQHTLSSVCVFLCLHVTPWFTTQTSGDNVFSLWQMHVIQD